MLFIEFRFILLFAIAFSVHWTLQSHSLRKLWLLAVSYLVYGAWDWRYLLLILTSTIIDWYAGRGAAPGQPHRKPWLWVSLIGNLSLLGFFKYYNFFVESGSEFLRLIGLSVDDHTLAIILPVGISFYTFQTLSYTIDIYRGRLKPTDRFSDLAVFVAFFPQLVAGPIVRAKHFMPQLVDKRIFKEHVNVRFSLAIFFFGFVKKACISDQIAPIIDTIFSNPLSHDTLTIWLGSFLFSIQVYCDFSGYSDMAIGLAGLLGYKLPLNFNFPYFSPNFTKFWQRWHITLGAWFTDYLYIPLGGSRGSEAATMRNLMIIFFVSGLWHGAAWTFVIWGISLGVINVIERAGLGPPLERSPAIVSFAWVTFMWLNTTAVFRSNDLPSYLLYFGRMWGYLPIEAPQHLISHWWWAAVIGWYLLHFGMYKLEVLERVSRLPGWLFAILLGAGWALAIPWVGAEYTPFIYFQF